MHFEQDGADRNHQNRQIDQELHDGARVFIRRENETRGSPSRSAPAAVAIVFGTANVDTETTALN